MKKSSTFYNRRIRDSIRKSASRNSKVSEIAKKYIKESEYWLNLEYGELKRIMFPPDLKRSWFVLSDGKCPECKKSVPMYNWLHDPFNHPWKMQCPHCETRFPSNDFGSFYESGLDSEGVFHRETADMSLLKAPDGGGCIVDDGNGWVDENGKRYLFIAAYLAHSHWIKLVYQGVLKLAFCHLLTGEGDYAKRASLIFYSIARHFPDFDFKSQGVMYEKENFSEGYVTYWANACNELRMMAIAYDQIFDFLIEDAETASHTGKNPAELAEFIEKRIFEDTLSNTRKIDSNPPNMEVTLAVIKTVLDYDRYKSGVERDIDEIIKQSTKVDGLSGERGLSGYAAIAPRVIADLLCLYTNTDEYFMPGMLERHPVLYDTYRFHINTWYDAKYYPGIGDGAVFAMPIDKYTALFAPFSDVDTFHIRSRAWFAMQLYEHTGDVDFAKALYISNGMDCTGCFDRDIYMTDPAEWEAKLKNAIKSHGAELVQESKNYEKWRLSLLHAGSGKNKCMLAMPYDTGANHCHHDALSLHLFAKGIYLTPDFGYPPVNYGGWFTKEVDWYRHPASHNSVVIDGSAHTNLPGGKFYRYPEFGRNLMFASSSFVQAAYDDSREYAGVHRYERMAAIIGIPDGGSYFIDISRTSGGREHSRFFRTSYAGLTSEGVDVDDSKPYYPDRTIMRNFRSGTSLPGEWSADFKIDDVHKVLKDDRTINVRYIGLTPGSQITFCESWVDITRMQRVTNELPGEKAVWIPTLIESLPGPGTQFTSVIEAYEESPSVLSCRKIGLEGSDGFKEVVEIETAGGFRDIVILDDPGKRSLSTLSSHDISTDALFAVLRFNNEDFIEATVSGGTFLKIGKSEYHKDEKKGKVEFV